MELIEIEAYQYGECIGHGTYCLSCADAVYEANDHIEEFEVSEPEGNCCTWCGRGGRES